jgi:hypothetical protein
MAKAAAGPTLSCRIPVLNASPPNDEPQPDDDHSCNGRVAQIAAIDEIHDNALSYCNRSAIPEIEMRVSFSKLFGVEFSPLSSVP